MGPRPGLEVLNLLRGGGARFARVPGSEGASVGATGLVQKLPGTTAPIMSADLERGTTRGARGSGGSPDVPGPDSTPEEDTPRDPHSR